MINYIRNLAIASFSIVLGGSMAFCLQSNFVKGNSNPLVVYAEYINNGGHFNLKPIFDLNRPLDYSCNPSSPAESFDGELEFVLRQSPSFKAE